MARIDMFQKKVVDMCRRSIYPILPNFKINSAEYSVVRGQHMFGIGITLLVNDRNVPDTDLFDLQRRIESVFQDSNLPEFYIKSIAFDYPPFGVTPRKGIIQTAMEMSERDAEYTRRLENMSKELFGGTRYNFNSALQAQVADNSFKINIPKQRIPESSRETIIGTPIKCLVESMAGEMIDFNFTIDPEIPTPKRREENMMQLPAIKRIYANEKSLVTVVEFTDGMKIKVTRSAGTTYDVNTAVAYAITKRLFGSTEKFVEEVATKRLSQQEQNKIRREKAARRNTNRANLEKHEKKIARKEAKKLKEAKEIESGFRKAPKLVKENTNE